MNARGFSVCPMDIRFSGRLAAMQKRRKPFSERASMLARESQRYRLLAAQKVGLEQFQLARTAFEVKDRSTRLSSDSKAALIAYSACLDAPRISIQLSDLPLDLTMISLHATEKFPNISGLNKLLLVLEFSFNSFATLNYIKSQGLGGKALPLFYNVVREIGARKIIYFLNRDNVQALGFYVHTDFGGPVDLKAVRWELNIEQDQSQ